MNETLKTAIDNARTYAQKLTDLAELIEHMEDGDGCFDKLDAQNLKAAAGNMTYFAYMCEREAEQIQIFKRKFGPIIEKD